MSAPAELHGLVIQSNEEYHAHTGSISKSHLDVIAKTPAHYYDKYMSPDREREEPTPAMILGSATHSAILEPDLFPNEYMTIPEDAPRKPTSVQLKAKNPSADTLIAIDWWQAFERENAGRTILSPDDYKLCLSMRDAVHKHPVAGPLFRNGVAEQAYYVTDEETGELIKCRPDWVTDSGLMIDVKSTDDASPDGFAKSVANYRYWIQAPWYLDIFERLYGAAPEWFIFVAVEKKRPYVVQPYFVENVDLELGRRRYMKDLRRIAECKASGNWPGYSDQVEPIRLPKWLNTLD